MVGSLNTLNSTNVGVLHDVDRDVRTGLLRQLQPVRFRVDRDKAPRALQFRDLQHAKPDIAHTADHYRVTSADLTRVNRMPGARHRLDIRCLALGQRFRNPMQDRLVRNEVEAGHAAVGLLLEAKDPVPLAHPLLATRAVPAVVAGDDLLGDNAVSLVHVPFFRRARSKRRHAARVFMSGNDRSLDITTGAIHASEELSTKPAFHGGPCVTTASIVDVIAPTSLNDLPSSVAGKCMGNRQLRRGHE
jgi:hypothetical protein